MSVIILYGIKDNVKDVTEICLEKLTNNNIITIPNSDHNRAKYFIDHLIGTEKKIFITINNEEFEYNQSYIININLKNFTITTDNNIDNNRDNNIDNNIENNTDNNIENNTDNNIENNIENNTENNTDNKIKHNKLQIKYEFYKKYQNKKWQ
jgi:hypothetical protein